MKLGEKFLKLLQNIGFKKKGDSFYYISPLVLKNTNNFLVVYCKTEADDMYLSDNSQIIDAYDATNVDFEYLKNCVVNFANKADVNYDKGCLIKKINKDNFLNELSDFFKFLVLLEKYLDINV